MPAKELTELYYSHDLLLFPPPYDSGGFLVLEAVFHSMPVVCLDLGDPEEIATSRPGLIIE
jgi:glycosyltransferase involved in cell wall biosynthesis